MCQKPARCFSAWPRARRPFGSCHHGARLRESVPGKGASERERKVSGNTHAGARPTRLLPSPTPSSLCCRQQDFHGQGKGGRSPNEAKSRGLGRALPFHGLTSHKGLSALEAGESHVAVLGRADHLLDGYVQDLLPLHPAPVLLALGCGALRLSSFESADEPVPALFPLCG